MVSAPAVAETHISTVFFAGDRVYKLLKPIRTSFLDHSTIEQRLLAVDEEVALNRRLAPDVYLGTADVTENGRVVDRMIVMRRLPAGRRLTALVGTDTFSDCVRAIARTMAVFHSEQLPLVAEEEPSFDGGPDPRKIAGRDAVRKNWYDNFDDIDKVVGTVIPEADAFRVRYLVDRYLEYREGLFDQRIADGFVRDGHGDLTAEDIFCMPEGPRILDCLAFDPILRISDVLADVAFLAMDLDRLSGSQASHDFVAAYCEFSNEHHPASLAHHYVAYRAHVRTKVATLRHQQGDQSAAAMAQAYHQLCLRHLERASLSVTLVGGTPGTGKSSLAHGLSGALGAMLLSTDELRKDLAGKSHLEHETSSPDEGIYNPDSTRRTYAALSSQTSSLLDRAESVVLDASWNRRADSEALRQMAEAKGAEVFEIECVLDAETARERIAKRLIDGLDPSDARPELVDELRNRFEPWPSATKLDSLEPPEAVLARALDLVSPR